MKFQFEADLDYQQEAIRAAADLFRGQERREDGFRLTRPPYFAPAGGVDASALGAANRLSLTGEAILRNLRDVQTRNAIPLTDDLASHEFTVEMETGTGKTYVYLRTIFELHQLYAFTKFVIVVPSVAIREGVIKSLEMMREHFRDLYSGATAEHFVYDSTRLELVQNFTTSQMIQIMVMTVGSINRASSNVIYSSSEKIGGERPIDLISATNPIVVVDEPQSVEGGLQGRGREALARMNPLCTLRYSATHIDRKNMIYRLDAVDAYQMGLVKQIEVASATLSEHTGTPHLRLVDVRKRRGNISAKVEIDVFSAQSGTSRKTVVVQSGDDLQDVSRLAVYSGHRIGEIRLNPKLLELRVPGSEVWIAIGESYGMPDSKEVHREMIRRTIREHFDKEVRFAGLGIKVLSLFFIDKVSHYRVYGRDGGFRKGEYALMFEEEYRRLARSPDYRDMFANVSDLAYASEQAHNGYFSADQRNRWMNTDETTQINREMAERAYRLIMRDKEELLSARNPLKFIFSHSALREGWDNPNVFQICALREIHGEIERRQTLGRGLRLCVNSQGARVRESSRNVLTVVARESYTEYATNLQCEIEEQTGIIFGIVTQDQFSHLLADGEDNDPGGGRAQSEELWEYLREKGYIDSSGRVSSAFHVAHACGRVTLPRKFQDAQARIVQELMRCSGRIPVRDADERRTLHPCAKILHGEEFTALWDRIKHKTTYRLHFDNEKLIQACTEAIKDMPHVQRPNLIWEMAKLDVDQTGISANLRGTGAPVGLSVGSDRLPDVLTEVQNLTRLTRRSLARILVNSKRSADIRRNPRKFVEAVARIINNCRQMQIVDGVKYRRMGEGHYYSQELFVSEELTAYVRNTIAASKSVHDLVICDSETEREFAQQLELSEMVRVYAKLPTWFKIPTPLGTYTPDWALLVQHNAEARVYFVAETKGARLNLRPIEKAKTELGAKHFGALKTDDQSARYMVIDNFDQLRSVLL